MISLLIKFLLKVTLCSSNYLLNCKFYDNDLFISLAKQINTRKERKDKDPLPKHTKQNKI